jgi:putative DNA base modification enzyme with NMAD domain
VAAFLANVGVNAGHAARSPLFDDGTFALLPIPEQGPWLTPMLRLDDLERLHIHAPKSWRHRAVHLDPDLAPPTATYGDNCRRAGRAFSLRRAQPGDLIVFIARLHGRGGPAFHLVGHLEIEDALEDVTRDPGRGWWDGNAHVRRARATGRWDSFWVFRGTASSRLLHRAISFGRRETELLFGEAGIRWPSHRTELQTIGSYTRTVRRVEGRGEEWLRTACRY